MNERVKVFFKQNIGYLIVALVSLIYIATAVINVEKTGKTLAEIIADGAIVLFLGFSINRVFDLQGILNGNREAKVQATYALHNQKVLKISPYIDRLDDWCKIKNEENLRVQRTRILATEGMKYEDYFDEGGAAKDFKIDEERLKNKILRSDELRRIHCFRKALRLKLTPLSAGALTSEGGKTQDPYFFGRTKSQYEKQTSIQDIVSRILIAFIFGYYGVSPLIDFSYANLIWKALQVGLFLIMGTITMYNSYIFIVDEYRGRIIKKIDNLIMFENYINGEKSTEENNQPLEVKEQSTETEDNTLEVKQNTEIE